MLSGQKFERHSPAFEQRPPDAVAKEAPWKSIEETHIFAPV
jgi:hypothetical protein